MRETLVGADAARPRGSREAPTRVSSYPGNDPARWVTDFPTCAAVSLGQAYDGIEVELRAHPGNVEKLFRLAPGADPGRIRVAVGGASGLAIDPEGRLAVATAAGPILFTRPVA